MKAWAIGVLTAVLFGTAVGAPVCFAADEDVEIDGLFEDSKIACDPAECTRLGNRKEQIAARLEELYARWEELQEE